MQIGTAHIDRGQPSDGLPPHACTVQMRSTTDIILDVLVIDAASLVPANERARTIERIGTLSQRTTRTFPGQGPWLLVMTHSSLEREQAYQLTLALSGRCCQGVRAVTERDCETTGRAALALHRLHFPTVAERLRPSRILVLGSIRERAVLI